LYYAPNATENWIWGSNTYTSFSSYKTGSTQDANSQYADPMFVNTNAKPPTTLLNLQVRAGPGVVEGDHPESRVDRGTF